MGAANGTTTMTTTIDANQGRLSMKTKLSVAAIATALAWATPADARVTKIVIDRSSELSSDCMVEHAADGGTIESPCLHAEADDFAGELIHHDQHPVGSQDE